MRRYEINGKLSYDMKRLLGPTWSTDGWVQFIMLDVESWEELVETTPSNTATIIPPEQGPSDDHDMSAPGGEIFDRSVFVGR
jgi:hypothetical protein